MRSKATGRTPREEALVILCQWATAAYEGLTADLLEVDDRDSFRVQGRSAMAKEHNRLAARVKDYGETLDDEQVYLPPAVASTNKYSEE